MNPNTTTGDDASATARDRGAELLRERAVTLLEADETLISADVLDGEHRLRVLLHPADERLTVFCSCDAHGAGGECAHVYAALAAAVADNKIAPTAIGALVPFGERSKPEEGSALDSDDLDGDAFDDDAFGDELGDGELGQDSAPWADDMDPTPQWLTRFDRVQISTERRREIWRDADQPAGEKELLYLLQPDESADELAVLIVRPRQRKKNGQWSAHKRINLEALLHDGCEEADRRLLALIFGVDVRGGSRALYDYNRRELTATPASSTLDILLPLLAKTGRLYCTSPDATETETTPLISDTEEPWSLKLRLRKKRAKLQLEGRWTRAGVAIPLDAPRLLLAGGFFVHDNHLFRWRDTRAWPWIALLKDADGPITAPIADVDRLLERMFATPYLPPTTWPKGMKPKTIAPAPRPAVHIDHPSDAAYLRAPYLLLTLTFDYDGAEITADDGADRIYDRRKRAVIVRDPAAERAAIARLRQLGARPLTRSHSPGVGLQLPITRFGDAVSALTAEGWSVTAEDRPYRTFEAFDLRVEASGIDWFDVEGQVTFAGQAIGLPRLLTAAKRGETFVELDDGSLGIIPERWLKRYGVILAAAEPKANALRYRRNQVGLIELLLEEQRYQASAAFEQARARLQRFSGLKPARQPARFVGELRDYQRQGLAWLSFLREYGLGGCLADDMGLGKTIQALALLLRCKGRKKVASKPSLIVVPLSLLHNWQNEAARFAPSLSIYAHAGAGRGKDKAAFDGVDVVLTTYGTLRRDALLLKDIHFEILLLDEAQAIKNPASQTAKAARLLRGDLRLALSGTPVENNLRELWSLFEFLNPGMLGQVANYEGRATVDPEAVALLARAVRPLLLRRKKADVAPELPDRLEQTIVCELGKKERALYDELRVHYRGLLLQRQGRSGDAPKRGKIQILEALLRLRQAACHGGLIDAAWADDPSAKFDLLIDRLQEVAAQGHKALVFSQFTSLLALLRGRLDTLELRYEYLDGKTRDRQARIESFSGDPHCSAFLISLKAGGLGLNLTAADHVFLLDPWWNPAVEAQAIDRAHRIGQKKTVFAFRLIAKDTVEEKIIELQQRKRDLAASIISGAGNTLRELTRADLDLLLS